MATEFYFHDGAAPRKATELYYHDGAAVRKVKEAWYNDGTAPRKVFTSGGLVGGDIGGVDGRRSSAGTLIVRMLFNSDGTITSNHTGATTYNPVAAGSKWYDAAPSAGIGSSYYIRISDTPPNWSSWTSLSSGLTYTLGAATGETNIETVLFELSSSPTGPAEASGQFAIVAAHA